MISLVLVAFAFAADLPGEEVYVAPSAVPLESSAQLPKAKAASSGPSRKLDSNLPLEFLKAEKRTLAVSEIILPPKGTTEMFRGLRPGDNLSVSVEHSVIAFPDEKAPVIATVLSGANRGLRFIGESYLEPNSKRVFINFNRVVSRDQVFSFRGVGLSSAGQPGLIGVHHSREAEYFAGDFISSFVAGYFDGLVPTRTNAFGQIEKDTSVDSAVKKGLASGSLSTAERFREKLKKVPEFSEVQGPFEIQLLILEQPKTNN